jgi:hypothetical protein
MSKVPLINGITRMSHLLVCLNSSANFLIYYLNGEKFRKAWVETYGERCCCCFAKSGDDRSPGRFTMQTLKTDNHCMLPPEKNGNSCSIQKTITYVFIVKPM